jgi:antitoxin Phd
MSSTRRRPARPPQTATGLAEPQPPSPRTGTLTLPSTEVQGEFGRVLDQAARDQDIVITRHDVPRAVLISASRYRELVGREMAVLDTLRGQLDALYARMQTPEVEAGTERGFNASPAEMGRAALAAARRAHRARKSK